VVVHGQEEEEDAVQPFVVHRDRSLDPQLVWEGKDEQNAKPLEVPAVALHVQEKIHPQAVVEDDRERAGSRQRPVDLFADFNGLDDLAKKLEFYQHDQHWTNRLILADDLLVMASLAETERLHGRVQCVYFDPPYGIKFGSNWQVSTRKRDVKDAKAEDLTRQPQQIKAFRDTWELGIHSYLTYLRDRLTVARDLLTESRSIFVRTGNLFTVFGEPDVTLTRTGGRVVVTIRGVDVFDPSTGAVRTGDTDDIASWFIDTDDDGQSFFVRHAYFLYGGKDTPDGPYDKLKNALRAEIDEGEWSRLYNAVSQPFDPPKSGKIAVQVINHFGDEVLKVYPVRE
jgi:adenine-specific DNA-methyltransferase